MYHVGYIAIPSPEMQITTNRDDSGNSNGLGHETILTKGGTSLALTKTLVLRQPTVRPPKLNGGFLIGPLLFHFSRGRIFQVQTVLFQGAYIRGPFFNSENLLLSFFKKLWFCSPGGCFSTKNRRPLDIKSLSCSK